MADKKNDAPVLDDEEIIVEMTDEDGNTYLYIEEMIVPVNGERFAILVSADEHECEDEDCDCDEGDVIIAKIVVNENGEDEYIEPTDEEFFAFQKAYDEITEDYYE